MVSELYEPADAMQLHAQHVSSRSYSTDDLAVQLHSASLQHSAAAWQSVLPSVPSDSSHIAAYAQPGAAARYSMPPAALSAAPAEGLLLWDRRHASAAAAAVSEADSLDVCSI